MSKLSFFSIFIFLSVFAIAQPAGKWSTGGNAISTGDFIGTTNNFPLDFRTNNNQVMSLDANGNLSLKNLIGSGNRILITDPNGNISFLPQGTSGQFLLSNGTWANLPAGSTSFNVIGNDLFTTNSGNFGIGTSSPSYKLDVFGDARISNNLYVGGGIVITNKVDASVEVKAGDIIVNNDLNVSGNTNFLGLVTSKQGVLFDATNNVGLKFQAGSIPGSGTFIFGKSPSSPLPACAALPGSSNTFQLGGNAQIWDPSNSTNPGLLNLQTWAGGSSIDASTGGTTSVGALLLNYFCGSNTAINTGNNGGSVYVGKEFYADRNSQIGANWLALNQSVALNIFENSTTELLKLNSSTNSTKLISSNNGQFVVYGNGAFHSSNVLQLGFTNPSIQESGTFLNINSGNSTALKIIKTDDYSYAIQLKNTNSNKDKLITMGDGTTFIGEDWASPGTLFSTLYPKLTTQVKSTPGYMPRAALFASVKDQSINESAGLLGFCAAFESNTKNTRAIAVLCTDPTLGSLSPGQYFETFRVYADGRTRIGTQGVPTHNTALLTVAGEIVCKALYVFKPITWQDHVFNNDYNLPELNEVEKYIELHKHLPGLRSESDIKENGYDVNEIDAALLEKIENLYLYVIKQQKEIELLKTEIRKQN